MVARHVKGGQGAPLAAPGEPGTGPRRTRATSGKMLGLGAAVHRGRHRRDCGGGKAARPLSLRPYGFELEMLKGGPCHGCAATRGAEGERTLDGLGSARPSRRCRVAAGSHPRSRRRYLVRLLDVAELALPVEFALWDRRRGLGGNGPMPPKSRADPVLPSTPSAHTEARHCAILFQIVGMSAEKERRMPPSVFSGSSSGSPPLSAATSN